MNHQPSLCPRCKTRMRLPYHPYCKECRREYNRAHPQKYKPHPRPTLTWEQCFWPKVQKTDDCWFWTGAKNRRGYPHFKVGLVSVDAGRFIYEQRNGPIPDGLVLYRTCRIRCCVNPIHLGINTRKNIPRESAKSRFNERVNKNGPVPPSQPELGSCWLWKGRITPFGYGAFCFEGRDQPAHRVSWIITNGQIVGDLDVCHRCDVPQCVRPEHLFLGTAHDNIMDCQRKGRAIHPRGEKAGKAKLRESQVLAILALYIPGKTNLTTLARIFHVTTQCIFAIVHRRTWTHLQESLIDTLIQKA